MCVFVSALSLSYFILNKRTGFLIIKENAPTGTYQFQIRVSDGVWPDAISSVTVHVRELRDEAIYNSGSLRLAGELDATETHTAHMVCSVACVCPPWLRFDLYRWCSGVLSRELRLPEMPLLFSSMFYAAEVF